MGAVGRDFKPYAEWMDRHEISRRHLYEAAESYTAQAYITTDIEDNQITAFHPGQWIMLTKSRCQLTQASAGA